MEQNTSLLTGKVWKSLLKFAIPVLLANILQVVYSAADMWVVGRFATTADVSAVAISSQIMITLILFISGLTTGTAVMIGQFCGADNKDGIKRTIGSAIFLFAIVAVVIMVPLLVFKNSLIAFMKTPEAAVGPSRSYMMICTIGVIFTIGYNVVSSITRGFGDSKSPLIFVAVAAVVNLIVDIIFVKVLQWGAAGAAVATVGSQAGSMIFAILFLKHKGLGFKLTIKDIKIDSKIVKSIFKIGIPIGFQEFLISISFMFITWIVNQMGLSESAAVGVVEKLVSFLAMPIIAMMASVSTMASHNIGAHQFERAKKALFTGVGISFAFAVLANCLTLTIGDKLVSLFTTDPEVIRVGQQYLMSYAIDTMMMAIIFNFNSFFSACNHSTFSMVHSICTTFLVRVPIVFIMSRLATVNLFKIGLGAPIASAVSSIACIIFFIYINKHEDPEKMIVTR